MIVGFKMNILLIDDEPDVINDILSLGGYQVSVATDGLKGISTFELNPFDLVILDLRMPIMDGWTVLNAIREKSNVYIIMLTASGDEKMEVSGLRQGADEYLTKPISPSKLLARIEAMKRRLHWKPQNSQVLPCASQSITQREKELLKYLIQGYSNQKIAETLFISETTVKNHFVNLFKKMNVKNRTQASFIAQKTKLV
jgi:two-component system, OmpR family, response regulator VanR